MEKKSDFLFLIDLAPYTFSIQVYQISGKPIEKLTPQFHSNFWFESLLD